MAEYILSFYNSDSLHVRNVLSCVLPCVNISVNFKASGRKMSIRCSLHYVNGASGVPRIV